MKAWKLSEVGKIEFSEKTDIPQIEKNEVLVHIKAAGICGSDIPRVYKTGAHKMPLIIGHEFSGVVKETGIDVNKEWIGKRVGIFPLIPCKNCPACRAKKYEMCSHYNYLGSRCDGGFSEYAAVPEWNLVELPKEVSFEQAAMLEPMSVAVHAMRQLELNKDDKIIVCGAGTIGQLLVMFLLERGMDNVFVLVNKEIQKKALLKLGLKEDNFFDVSASEDLSGWVKEKTKGRMADAYFECVGKPKTVSLAFNMIRPGGQICMVGNPASDIVLDKNTYWKLLRGQYLIKGTWNSSYLGKEDEEAGKDDWHYVLNCLKNKRIEPEKIITHTMKLEELKKGLEIMRDKDEDYIKIMVMCSYAV